MLFIFFKYKSQQRRYILFIVTNIVSVFFFSSTDPFLGIPLYFYLMILSEIAALLTKRHKITLKNKLNMYSILLIFSMVLQIVLLILNFRLKPILLLNKSNTDTIDISKELYLPTFNFTVFKHFIFFVMYIIYILLNVDLIDSKMKKDMRSIIIKIFHILFICIISESIIVNFTGWNDRAFMSFIFNVESNQKENWKTFGISSVCFNFTERSEIGIIFIYFNYIICRGKINNEIKWIILAAIAVFCTGSSTGIVIVGIYAIIIFIQQNIIYRNIKCLLIDILFFVVAIFLVYKFGSILFEKVNEFIAPKREWGSAYFRRVSINYAISDFIKKPMLGYGIGTLYAHGMLFQVLGNIGIVGVFLTFKLHFWALNIQKNNKMALFLLTIFLIISFSSFLLQNFTSPWLLVCFMSISFKNFDNKKVKKINGDVLA